MSILDRFIKKENSCHICEQNPLDKELIYDPKIKQYYHMECLQKRFTKRIENAINNIDDI